MNEAVPPQLSAVSTYNERSLALIRRTVARDCTDDEFNVFIHMARALGLDPLRRQIHAFVFDKTIPEKRRLAVITAIDGFRTIAERTGSYRPDEDEPTYKIVKSLMGPTNPAGLVKATVRVWKHAHGGWHRVTGSAYWDEYAPLSEEWAVDPETDEREPTGQKILASDTGWSRMPRLMLAKVAEALALRKAWPDAFSNVYASEEVDRARFDEETPFRLGNKGELRERDEKLFGPSVPMNWLDDQPIENVPLAKLAERCLAFIELHQVNPALMVSWRERNRHALRQLWAHHADDALKVKRRVDELQAKLQLS